MARPLPWRKKTPTRATTGTTSSPEPTATRTAEAESTATEAVGPAVALSVDRDTVNADEPCVTLTWQIEGAEVAYLSSRASQSCRWMPAASSPTVSKKGR